MIEQNDAMPISEWKKIWAQWAESFISITPLYLLQARNNVKFNSVMRMSDSEESSKSKKEH